MGMKDTEVGVSAQEIKKIKEEAKNRIKEVKSSAKKEIEQIKMNCYAALEPAKAARRIEKNKEKQERKAMESSIPKRYSIGEEIFNSVTHGIGAGLAVAATVLLIVRAVVYAPEGDKGFYVTSFSIFGASLIVLYLMSTLYHALTPYGAKKVFAVFDHSSIYLLIAGTYTPFCLTALRGPIGWTLFGVIWGLAIIGVTLYAIFGSRMRILSVITYILMGWMIIFAIKPMIQSLNPLSLRLVIAGGVAYTLGCIFYALKKIKWMHCVWHIFVIFGSMFHFFAVYFSVPL